MRSASRSEFPGFPFDELSDRLGYILVPRVDVEDRGMRDDLRGVRIGEPGIAGSTVGELGSDRRIGVQGRFLTGVCGRSGSTTVKDRLKGHSVFSN